MKRLAPLLVALLVSPAAAFADGALPAAGASWTYRYTDVQYGRKPQIYSVRAISVDGATVNDTLASEGGAGTPAALSVRAARFVPRLIAGGRTLIEFSPYALAAGAAPAWQDAAGYPTGYASYLDWTISVKTAGWEEIRVPAGSFRALRVEAEGRRGSDPEIAWQAKQAGRFRYTVWYAPEARRYVKAHHQSWAMTQAPFGEELLELVAYRAD